jgi:type IV secretory pathway VirB10-like protein
LNTRLAVAQSRLDATRQGLLQTILILAIILTAFMLWLIFTQYLAIRYALVRIHAAPEKKPEFPAAVPSTPTAVEPINEVVPAPVTEPTSPTGTVTAIAPEPVVPAPVVEEDVEPPLASEPVKSTKPTANKSAAKSTSKKASASKKPTKKGNKK